ncbi:MAG: GGDEF domain-containing protein [Acidobacteriota bacterium]
MNDRTSTSRRTELTTELLDTVVLRDRQRLSEITERVCVRSEVALWLIHRWDPAEERFQLVYPLSLERECRLPAHVRGVLLRENRFVDANRPEFYGSRAETNDYPTTLFLPLSYNSELLAVLQGYSAADRQVSRMIIDQLAPEVEWMARGYYLMQLLDERDRLASTDLLTGLSNYHFLMEFLHSEVARCRRYESTLAIIFLDIDWFKRVNESFGHLVGSDVLKQVGGLLRRHVRESDIVARYGGDEYVVVLRESGREDGWQIAERLRKTISENRFAEKAGYSIGLTVSAGIALFPEHGQSAGELIERADQAMFAAKNNQKNCVKIAVN